MAKSNVKASTPNRDSITTLSEEQRHAIEGDLTEAIDMLDAISAIAWQVLSNQMEDGHGFTAIDTLAKNAIRHIDVVQLELGSICSGNQAEEFQRLGRTRKEQPHG